MPQFRHSELYDGKYQKADLGSVPYLDHGPIFLSRILKII